MHPGIERYREAIGELCRRHGVRRLDLFGWATRPDAFDPARSDVDLLIEVDPAANDLRYFLDLKEDLELLLERPVDLVERRAVETSRDPIRRSRILAEATPLHGVRSPASGRSAL